MRAIACALFGVAFGVGLIVAGWRRLRQVGIGAGPGTRESVVWGTIGIALGVALIAAVVWMVAGPPPE